VLSKPILPDNINAPILDWEYAIVLSLFLSLALLFPLPHAFFSLPSSLRVRPLSSLLLLSSSLLLF